MYQQSRSTSQNRLYFLRRLGSFNVCRTTLQMLYHSVVASVIYYAVVFWGSRVKAADADRLNKLIRKVRSALGVELESLWRSGRGGCRVYSAYTQHILSIMDNASSPAHHNGVIPHHSQCPSNYNSSPFWGRTLRTLSCAIFSISCAILPFNIMCNTIAIPFFDINVSYLYCYSMRLIHILF